MDKVIKATLLGILAVSTIHAASATTQQNPSDNNQGEKCYGIVKAGMNDCETTHTDCAGSSVKDKQGDAYLLLPTGTCNKIVGGSLKPIVTK